MSQQQQQLDHLKKVNQVCDAFETKIRHGELPKIEPIINELAENVRDSVLTELIRIELFYLGSQGVHPEIESYYQRFPDHCDSVLRAFDETQQAEQIDPFKEFEEHSISREVGEQIGDYKIEQVLGSGAFAQVVLAYDQNQNLPVAIKAMKPIPGDNGRFNDRAIRSFTEEAKLLTSLNSPSIAQIYDVGIDQYGLPFVVMEYVKGDSLQFLLREQLVDFETAVKLIADTAEALADIHSQHVFHRDLKPANIIVGLDGQPRIVDFGLAVNEAIQHQRKGEIAGTISYMSPEQIKGQSHRLDGRTDIWSLGVILYEILTSRLPFRGPSRPEVVDEILKRDPRPIRQINTKISPELEAICLKALKKDSRERHLTSLDFCHELRNELGDLAARTAKLKERRVRTAREKADLRLATQARFWNEQPESQRLPTIWQYFKILFNTDAMTRTAGESRMMTSAFWYFAKRTALVFTVVTLLTATGWWFLYTNRIAVFNRERETNDLLARIGQAPDEAERRTLGRKLQQASGMTEKLVDLVSAAHEEESNRKFANYVVTLIDDGWIGETKEKRHSSIKKLETLLNQLTNRTSSIDDEIKSKIESKSGLINSRFVICGSLNQRSFDQINDSLSSSKYCLFDFHLEENLASAIWHRNIDEFSPTNFVAAGNFEEAKQAFLNQPKPEFDINRALAADFFSGGSSGLEGLNDFDFEFVDLNKAMTSNDERFRKELLLADNYVGDLSATQLFLRARAYFYLGQYEQCQAELTAIQDSFESSFDETHVQEVRSRLGAIRNDKIAAEHSLATLSKRGLTYFRTHWLLGNHEKVHREVINQKSSLIKAAVYSFIAGHFDQIGDAEQTEDFIAKSVESLKPCKTALKRRAVYLPELEFMRRRRDIGAVTDIQRAVVTSGKWQFDNKYKTQYTGGTNPFILNPTSHLKKAKKLAADGYIPTKIRMAFEKADRPFLNSIWKKRVIRRNRSDRIEKLALAIVARMKYQWQTEGKISESLYHYMSHSNDPTLRTEIIATFARLNLDIGGGILKPLNDFELPPSIQQALLSAMALYDPKTLNTHRTAIEDIGFRLDECISDPGVSSSLFSIRRKLGIHEKQNYQSPDKSLAANWHYNKLDQKFVKIPMSDSAERHVWFATTEMSLGEYARLIRRPRSTNPDSALKNISFYSAARICNRMSEMDGLPKEQWCYEPNEQGQYAAGMSIKTGYQSLNGYRLPTKEEWDIAYFAGAETTWAHGNDLTRTVLFSNVWGNGDELTVAKLLPNRFGLFDMGGNVAEWINPDFDQKTISDETSLELIGGYYSLSETGARSRTLDSPPHPGNFVNAAGIRIVKSSFEPHRTPDSQ